MFRFQSAYLPPLFMFSPHFFLVEFNVAEWTLLRLLVNVVGHCSQKAEILQHCFTYRASCQL